MIVKYESKSEKKFFDFFKKIEFSSKIFALTSDNFIDEFFFSDEVFFFSSFDKFFNKKRVKKNVKKRNVSLNQLLRKQNKKS